MSEAKHNALSGLADSPCSALPSLKCEPCKGCGWLIGVGVKTTCPACYGTGRKMKGRCYDCRKREGKWDAEQKDYVCYECGSSHE